MTRFQLNQIGLIDTYSALQIWRETIEEIQTVLNGCESRGYFFDVHLEDATVLFDSLFWEIFVEEKTYDFYMLGGQR